MKAFKKILFALILVSGFVYAQNDDKSEVIKSTINTLFDLCKNNKYEQAAAMIAYTGKNEKRNLAESYNYKDSKEASKVKRIAKKIKAFLDISDKFKIGSLKVSTVDNKNNYSVEVLFISGNQELKTLFTFIEAGNKILMADLN